MPSSCASAAAASSSCELRASPPAVARPARGALRRPAPVSPFPFLTLRRQREMVTAPRLVLPASYSFPVSPSPRLPLGSESEHSGRSCGRAPVAAAVCVWGSHPLPMSSAPLRDAKVNNG